jgi:ankyrin repeat protein
LEEVVDMKTMLRIFFSVMLVFVITPAWAASPEAALTILEQKGLAINNDTFVKKSVERDFEVVELFLDAGIDPNVPDQYGNTALIMATIQGYEDIVDLLLDHGADIKSRDKKFQATPLIWAALKGQTAVAKLLIDKGADLNAKENRNGMTALYAAVLKGYTEMVKIFLAKDVDINSRD